MNAHTTIDTVTSAALAGDAVAHAGIASEAAGSWDDLIAKFEAADGLQSVADFAKHQRTNGKDFHAFVDDLHRVFEIDAQCKTLDAVFDLSSAEGWNMSQPEIEAAMDEIRAGATAAQAYGRVKRAAGSLATIPGESDAWNAAVEARRITFQEERDADRAETSALSAFAEISPKLPASLGSFRPEITSVGALDKADIPLADKVTLYPILKEWLRQTSDARTECGLKAREEELNATYDRRQEIEAELMKMTPPDLSGLLLQFEIAGIGDHAIHVAGGLYAALQNPDLAGAAQVYVNLLRFVGGDHPQLEAVTFDPKRWLDAFEALPGHGFNTHIGPAYRDPEAWPSDRASDAEVTIIDPAIIERLYEDRPGDKVPASVQLGSIDRVERAFADDPAERDRLIKAIKSRQAGPVGRHLWTDLADWQQDAVHAVAKARCA